MTDVAWIATACRIVLTVAGAAVILYCLLTVQWCLALILSAAVAVGLIGTEHLQRRVISK